MTALTKFINFISDPKNNYPNIYIFLYHILKAVQKLLTKIGIYKNKYNNKDMFNWSLYSLHYKGELIEAKKTTSIEIKPGDYVLENDRLIKKNWAIKPLHLSHRFLYETIMLLRPKSIFEMGCGAGMHLNNLQALLPNVALTGIDLLESQIIILRRTFPLLNATIKVTDATVPFTDNFMQPVDLAFTQAVLMHIHTENGHLNALINLFNIATKYIILMESERTHHYVDDIKKLQAEKKINWENIYFYNRLDPETKQPMSIICSKEQLPYPEYNLLK